MGLLHQKGLKETRIRMRVLDEFTKAGKALSQQELTSNLAGSENRVSLYRVLRDFEINGILHRFSNENADMYALCQDCCQGRHNDEHIHFNCTVCKKTECIPQPVELYFNLPAGYQKDSSEILIKGVCAACR